jgi:hypothetical protein
MGAWAIWGEPGPLAGIVPLCCFVLGAAVTAGVGIGRETRRISLAETALLLARKQDVPAVLREMRKW